MITGPGLDTAGELIASLATAALEIITARAELEQRLQTLAAAQNRAR